MSPLSTGITRGLNADEALIDGEAVVLRIAQATLVAFDLLRLNGDDLRLRPIEEQREAQKRLVVGADGSPGNRTSLTRKSWSAREAQRRRGHGGDRAVDDSQTPR